MSAWAQQGEPYSIDSVLEFFEQTEAMTPADPIDRPVSESRSVSLMYDVIESVANDDIQRLTASIEQARALPDVNESDWPTALRLAEGVLTALNSTTEARNGDDLLQFLDDFDAEGHWYVKSLAHSLSGYIFITRNQILVAARYIDDAMQLIPTELSERVTNARLRTSDVSMVLHGMQGSPGFLLDAARVQRDVKAEIGETINRYELMTNFIFTLNRVRDFEGAAKIAELLMREKRPDDSLPGLVEGYIAETFNELHEYARARQMAELSLSLSDYPVVVKRAKYALVVALSGLGLDAEAHATMDAEGWEHDHNALLSEISKQAILHAEALLAMHKNDPKLALSLMKRRTDLLVQRVQRANSSDMTSLLTNLENTRERQSERESAIQREAELKAVQLEQKTKLNRLLWVLIGVLTLAFNLLLAFLRYRERLSGKVQDLQKDALSAEKMKTEFLGVINHELRTPLNGIIGISDAMIHHAKDPTMKAQAAAVQESGQLLFDLLDSLITMSTIEGNRLSLESETADLSTLIAREAEEWAAPAEKKGLAFTTFIAPELATPVIADEKRLRQCVRFLLSNAVRFTHEGRVHLHATAEPDETGQLAIKIIIADTGQGMSEEVQSRLFKPFLQADATMTRKYGGAGLSLAIGRKLARMMGGELTVTSRDGAGSEFIFTARLPLAEAAMAIRAGSEAKAPILSADAGAGNRMPTLALDAAAGPEEIIDLMLGEQLFESVDAAQTPPSGLSVLLADTGTPLTQGLREALKTMSCDIVKAKSGPQLLSLFDDARPDVVMLNPTLPDLDAPAVISRLRQRSDLGAPVLVVAFTSTESPADKAKLFSAGADLLLDLPIQPDRLAEALQQARSLRPAA